MPSEKHIPYIHNYCNRWCERCHLTHRCALYAREQAAIAKNPDIQDFNNEAFWQYLSDQFQEMGDLLRREAEKHDIDLDDLEPDEEIVQRDKDMMESARNASFSKSAHAYAMAAHQWLAAKRDTIAEQLVQQAELGLVTEDEQIYKLGDAIEVISWYLFQIGVKLQRAQSSYFEASLYPDEEVHQYDADGSAKVALIGIEHSLGAWSVLYQHLPEEQDEILSYLALLQRTQRQALQRFPNAMAFVRPGFDDGNT